MADERWERLRMLSEAPGAPGFEDGVREVMERLLRPVADEVTRDHLGSVIARKRGAADRPRIMLAGHMDEIGFMVTDIGDEGFIRFQPLGGWWEHVMLAQRVVIRTRKGDVMGVIGSKPPHVLSQDERNKLLKRQDMFIDVGARSRAEAESFGIRPGDPVVPWSPATPLANPRLLLGKAWDDRVGCALAVDLLYELQGADHPNTVFAVGTVQEEVGLRGAATSTYAVEPDVGLVLEVAIASDTPGFEQHRPKVRLGGGPAIVLYDSSMIPHARLRDFVLDVAAEEGIACQFEAMAGGGTDGGRMHIFGRGVPSLAIGVPTRYIHTHAGIVDRDDYEQALRLLVAVVRRLDAAAVERIRG